MTLEELIKDAAGRGLCHLTLHTVWSEDKKTVYWAARATPSTGHKYVSTQSRDPVEAATEVLKAVAKAPKRAPSKIYHTTGREPEVDAAVDVHVPADEITAAVTEKDFTGELRVPEPMLTPEPQEIDQWLPKT